MTSKAIAKARTSSRTPKVAILLLLLIAGCSGDKARTSSRTPKVASSDPWVITNLDPNTETPALLWNGLIGIRIKPDGSVGELASQSLYAIDCFEESAEEKIRPLLNPTGFGLSEDLSHDSSKPFLSTIDLKTGVLTSTYTTRSESQVTIQSVIDPEHRVWGQRLSVERANGKNFSVLFSNTDVDFPKESDPKDATWQLGPANRAVRISTKTHGIANETSEFVRAGARINGIVGKTGPLLIERVFSLAPKGGKPEPLTTFEQLTTRARRIASDIWQTDIEIDGPVEDQQFIRSALFYLRSSIHPEGKMSVSPMGLSSDIYNGHIFWDADIWVYPALALIDPGRASAIPRYRLNHLSQATQNGIDWLKANRPTGKAPMGSIEKDIVDIAKYPWESSVSGKETVPGPSKFQDHISGSVAWTTALANALGLVDPRLPELQRKVKNFYLFRSQKGAEGLFEIKGTMSPDEHHTGDNDLYTNLLAMWSTNGGKWPSQPTYKLPQDDKSLLTYDSDPVRGYKQAAAVLSIYPLQYPPAEKQARQMMERFADRVTKNGPAMTDSIHSIIWSRLGEKDKAYKTWHESWKPFVKPPFLLFSEKRNSSRTYFTTGAAGSLQAVLFGFAGLRIDTKKAPNAQWSMPLKNGQILSIAPNLPRAWKKLTLKNLTILGKKQTFEISGDKVKVTGGN